MKDLQGTPNLHGPKHLRKNRIWKWNIKISGWFGLGHFTTISHFSVQWFLALTWILRENKPCIFTQQLQIPVPTSTPDLQVLHVSLFLIWRAYGGAVWNWLSAINLILGVVDRLLCYSWCRMWLGQGGSYEIPFFSAGCVWANYNIIVIMSLGYLTLQVFNSVRLIKEFVL